MKVCCKFMSTESSALLIIGLNVLGLCLFWFMTDFEKFLSSFQLVEFMAELFMNDCALCLHLTILTFDS